MTAERKLLGSAEKASLVCAGFVHPRYVPKRTDERNVSCQLGAGSYGNVVLVQDMADGKKEVAVKVEKTRGLESSRSFQREAKILQQLSHKNVIALRDITKSQHQVQCWERVPAMLILEYAEKGDLATLLRRSNKEGFSEFAVASFFQQLVEGIHYLHSQRVLHRDLKPGNILLMLPQQNRKAEGHPEELIFQTIKIGDFGCAKVVSPSLWKQLTKKKKGQQNVMMRLSSRTAGGTEAYMPPETCFPKYMEDDSNPARALKVYREKCKSREYGQASDVFVLGLMFFELWTGKIADVILGELSQNFGEKDIKALEEIMEVALKKKTTAQSTKNVIRLLQDLLNPDPNMRVTLPNVLRRVWLHSTYKSVRLRKTTILRALERGPQEPEPRPRRERRQVQPYQHK